jgi:hypothetical protein
MENEDESAKSANLFVDGKFIGKTHCKLVGQGKVSDAEDLLGLDIEEYSPPRGYMQRVDLEAMSYFFNKMPTPKTTPVNIPYPKAETWGEFMVEIYSPVMDLKKELERIIALNRKSLRRRVNRRQTKQNRKKNANK